MLLVCHAPTGDELVTHTPEEERKHDAHEGLSKALMPSTIGQVGHEVTVQIYEARSLAALDSAGIMSDATSDPYITVEFAGAQPVSVSGPSLALSCLRVAHATLAKPARYVCLDKHEEVNVQSPLERKIGPSGFSTGNARQP